MLMVTLIDFENWLRERGTLAAQPSSCNEEVGLAAAVCIVRDFFDLIR